MSFGAMAGWQALLLIVAAGAVAAWSSPTGASTCRRCCSGGACSIRSATKPGGSVSGARCRSRQPSSSRSRWRWRSLGLASRRIDLARQDAHRARLVVVDARVDRQRHAMGSRRSRGAGAGGLGERRRRGARHHGRRAGRGADERSRVDRDRSRAARANWRRLGALAAGRRRHRPLRDGRRISAASIVPSSCIRQVEAATNAAITAFDARPVPSGGTPPRRIWRSPITRHASSRYASRSRAAPRWCSINP